MDLEDWEFLPDHGFIDYHEDYPRKSKRNYNNNTNNMFNMDHFKCPSSSPQRVITVPFHLEQLDDELEKNKHVITKLPLEVNLAPPPSVDLEKKEKKMKIESFDQVFFKKMKENEFVDMKQQLLDSPNSRVLLPQIENLKFDDDDAKSTKVESITEMKKNELVDAKTDDEEEEEENSNGNMNLWKMSLTGIGAICSFGVAAATICIIVLGSHRRNKHNQKFHFQIYTDDKHRIKQVVHHATKLNEAISSVRGVPVTRAHISFGGYYDAI